MLERSPRDGDLRTCVLRDGVVIRERIDEVNQAERLYRYSMVDSLMPVSNCQSTLRVREVSASRCRVEWSSSFEAPTAAAAQLIEMVRGLYDAGLSAVRAQLGVAEAPELTRRG